MIKLFISDVDGVLTDGSMYYSENGDEMKRFSTYDGMAFEMLRNKGIKTAIITSENTKIVSNRSKKMKIDFLYQGEKEEYLSLIPPQSWKKKFIGAYRLNSEYKWDNIIWPTD